MKPIIVITGPTAVGKTALSIDLARKFNGEIINADASQMRRDLNIGTAKISIDEMKNVKHHLIDFLDPLDKFSIKEFQKIGRDLIDKIEIPFIVGGSGLYIQALITDYQLDTSSRDESQFDNLSNEELHTLLKEQDSEAAVKIHPNNRRRVSRYLEIIRDRGKVQTSHPIPLYDVLTICLTTDRKILYDNINKRCDQMFVNGWIEECLDLKNKGIDLSLIKEIGYADINQYLEGNVSFGDVVELIKQKQRHYAKRQITWFKNKMDCTFVDLGKEDPNEIYYLIENHLKSK